MEALVLLVLAMLIGIPGAARALAFGLLGPLALIALVVWLTSTDFSQWAWWALGFVVPLTAAVALIVRDLERQDKMRAGQR
jgi:bacteriorhodopsin